jgi:CRP/FNR family transcriptional regulator, polysaccharide utilization system transcription regulator
MMKKILLIDDNEYIRENAVQVLKLANYEVSEAENGKAGVERAKAESPDLIICDIVMPQLDGFGVLHVLSKNPSTAGIPFIFLTAKNEREDIRKGMNLGADDYLVKPFNEVELLEVVDRRLKKKQVLHANFIKSSGSPEDLAQKTNICKGLEDLISDNRKSILIKKKKHLFAEGSIPNALFFLKTGKVKTLKVNEEGREYITNLYKDGDYLGYLDLLTEQPYHESAVAMEDSEVYIIPKDEFFSLVYQNREVADKFIKMLSDNVAEREERLLKLAYNSVRKRVAEALLLVEQHYQQTYKSPEEHPELSISREDLACLVGASKETVIRILAELKEEGLIETNWTKIHILDPARLANIH